MPRPQVGTRAAKTAPTNPISAWFAGRRERKAQEEEAAARRITDKMAENENTLQSILEGINFLHSKLSAETLNYKSNPNQKYGDLEQTARGLAQAIRKNPLTVDVDIRKIDEKLLILAQRFRDAVENGDRHAAYAAKAGLARGILDIRNRIPVHQPEMIEQFVELNTQYLDEWLTLVGFAQLADRSEENVGNLKVKYDQTREEYDSEVKKLYDSLQADPKTRDALSFIQNQTDKNDWSTWSEERRKVYAAMVDQRFKQVNIDLDAYQYQTEQTSMQKYLNDVDLLSAKLARVPIAVDPNQMNRYQEAIDNLFQEFARKDAELQETLTMLDSIEGRIKQLESAPGNLMARQVAAEQAQVALKKMREMQDKKVGERVSNRRQELNDLGLETEEDLQEIKRRIEEENQQQMEEYTQEFQEEGEQNYN